MNLNIKKAFEKIKLDDSPDSPEFVIDLTDKGVNEKSLTIVGAWSVYNELIGNIDGETPVKLASIYREVVDTMLGAGAFDTVCAYVGEGVPPEQMISILSPLVAYLLDLFNEVLTANHNRAVEKYLGA